MNLRLHTFNLELKHVFRISHSARTAQPTLIVELEEDGFSGFGEATATSYYGLNIDDMVATMESFRPIIESSTMQTPEQWWAELKPHLAQHPFLQCALDVAAHDLYAQKQGKPVYELWGLSLENLPLSNYTIGIASIEEMVEKMNAQPWPIYKVKLGTNEDIEIIQALRQHTKAAFRVDANCAWTATQTIQYAPQLKALGVEFIEQPMPKDAMDEMEVVFRESALPVIADESCQIAADVETCHQRFHGINIKLMKCGGLTPARQMITRAKSLGMQVMIGCMTESTIGISAIAHLLPLLDYVDMDGALLLKNDIADGVAVEDGKAIFPNRNGIGAKLI